MTPDRWHLVTEIFHGALARDAAGRQAFVADACQDDASLRAEVEALLAAHDDAGSFGYAPAFAPAIRQLAPGTPLGPYRIDSLIGAGGMGEVYRATDTRLGRTVAVKILPPHLRYSADLQSRFEREARTISQLTHPHICTLYDVGHEDGVDFLVMEFLEGETLAARLARGSVPLDPALRIGIEIAAALDHAHRHGVVHRDLKPGNVMLTKTGTKLLDFGLAKLRHPAGVSSSSPTVQSTQTAAGTVLGTLQYMAPEQFAGTEADARSDIWALGCVLYELATGQRAFEGKSHVTLIAAILEQDPPPVASIQALAPPHLDPVVRACLTKDPDERWQSAADVKRELKWIARGDRVADTGGHRLPRWKRVAAALVLLAAGAGIATVAWQRFAPHALPAASSHLTISLAAAGLTLTAGGVAISPDSQTLVFAARPGDGDPRLYMRRLDEWEPRPLKGTEGGITPFFSPDGTWLAFVANGTLKKLQLPAGVPQSLCKAGYSGHTRGSWDRDDRIVIGQWPGGLRSVSPEEGSVRPLTPDSASAHYLWPQVLPGGKTLLFTIREKGRSVIASLVIGTGVIRTIIESGSCARYLKTGHLVYESEGHLRVVGFDPERMEVRGASRVVIDDVAAGQTAVAMNLNYDVSTTGTIAFLPASTAVNRLVWKDRAGNTTPLTLEPRVLSFPSLSADGRRLTATVTEWPQFGVCTGSVEREPLIRLTAGGDSMCSLFSPDGRWIAYSSAENGWFNLFRVRADGSGAPQRLLTAAAHQKPTSWSPDGKVILFNEFVERGQAGNRDIAQMHIDHPGETHLVVHTPANELEATFSPDGRWVAYQSDDTGKWEVYVRPYAGDGAARQVSIGGGMGPAWNPRGGELFYQTRTALMAVRVENGAAVASPTKLFSYRKSQDARREFDVAPDGAHL